MDAGYTQLVMLTLLAAHIWILATLHSATSAEVHRCIGAHGETVFSGQPCSSLGAAVAPSYLDGNPLWNHGCAVNAEDLLDRVAFAFDSRDVNMLGGLFLWQGFGTRNAYQHMGRLADMLERPLLGLDLIATNPWREHNRYNRALPNPQPSSLAIWLANNSSASGPTEHRFALVKRDGCTWLSF